MADVYTIAGLVRIALPGHDILLCDGGFVEWPGTGTFVSKDPLFGTIEGVGDVTERVGDEAPSSDISLLPPDLSAASDLWRADAQNSPAHFWLADIDVATGAIVGTPDLQYSGLVDTLALRLSEDARRVEIGLVSEAERLFWTKEGNALSPAFHKRVWPGETGVDQATGTQKSVPWGVDGPPRGAVYAGGGGGLGGGSAGAFDGGRFNYSSSGGGVA